MKILILFLAISTCFEVRADTIPADCNNALLLPKIVASLQSAFLSLGQIDKSSVKTTPLIPEKYLARGQVPILAVFNAVTQNLDGTMSKSGSFAAQFLVNYSSCTPTFYGAGRLQ